MFKETLHIKQEAKYFEETVREFACSGSGPEVRAKAQAWTAMFSSRDGKVEASLTLNFLKRLPCQKSCVYAKRGLINLQL